MSRSFEEHLVAEAKNAARQTDFDMDDAAEASLEGCPPRLRAALEWLDQHVTQEWRKADNDALRTQRHHQRLARIAIAAGTASIVFAIVQLATKLTFRGLTGTALLLEAIAVVLAFGAVFIGLQTKFDRAWLAHRHRAERLRMLKFRALEKLWCCDDPTWQEWVLERLRALAPPMDFAFVEAWSNEGEIGDPVSADPRTDHEPAFTEALAVFYLHKRLQNQADYFQRRRDVYRRRTHRWQHLTLPFFLASITCVLLHFVLEALATAPYLAEWKEPLDQSAVWFVAIAAIIPVVGTGIRAWFAAFELPRSASLYGAKYYALTRAAGQLYADRNDAPRTQRHMLQTEHFLEGEHREWLRLLRDTEWFL